MHLLETDFRLILKGSKPQFSWFSADMFLTPTMIMPWTGILGKQMGFSGIGFPGLLAVEGDSILV